MGRRLAVLGRWAARRRRWVLAVWVLILVVIGGLGLALHGTVSTVYSVPGIESQRAQDLLQQKFPQAAGGTVRVVFAAPTGSRLTATNVRTEITDALARAHSIPGVIAVENPFSGATVSSDQRIGYADVLFAAPAADVLTSATDQLSTIMDPVRRAGVDVEFGGTAAAAKTELGGAGEIVGVVVAFVVLAIALSSLLAAGMPLATALVGVAVGVLGAQFLDRFVQLTGTATALATMLGLAVGIDYALFILTRHREQLADPDVDVDSSIGEAMATAGNAILFAGSTVIIALVSLSAAGIPFLTAMGITAAATVLIAVLIAVTLIPALLGFAGERLRPRAAPTGRRRRRGVPGAWGLTWARRITRAPVPVAVVGVAVLAVLAAPVLHLRLGLPSNETQPTSSTQHRSYQLLSRGFGPGFNATLAIVLDETNVPAAQRTALTSRVAAVAHADPDVATVGTSIANSGRTIAVITLVPRTGPDDQATRQLVTRLRTSTRSAANGAAEVYVAGATAANIDVSTKLGHALPLFLVIIVVLALILLAVAFRSIWAPVVAAVGFLLSVAAALGVVVWVFQYGHLASWFGVAAPAPIVSFVPVLLIGVLFGLAMDYEVFLVSRMRESYDQDGDAGGAVVTGVQRSGRVVSAAALIMASVFAGFVFTPDPIIKSIAFSLTVGVLLDAFVVRLTIIPAVMALLGRHAWTLPGRSGSTPEPSTGLRPAVRALIHRSTTAKEPLTDGPCRTS